MRPRLVIRRNFLNEGYDLFVEADNLPDTNIVVQSSWETQAELCAEAYKIALALGLPIFMTEQHNGVPEEVDPASVREVAQKDGQHSFDDMAGHVRSMYGKREAVLVEG